MKKVIAICLMAAVIAAGQVFAGNNTWSEGADINSDGIINYKDFAIMAKYWLESEPNDTMVWMPINDPGVSGHEGFNGEMSKYETTNEQYCKFLNAAKTAGLITVYSTIVYSTNDTSHSQPYFETYPANSKSQITYSDSTFSVRSRDGYSMATHPVVEVSWFGATAFCDYYGYRLPTEWEWQAVADYDGSYAYGCGATIDYSIANFYDNYFSNPLGLTSIPFTSPVGFYPAYGYGMCDMAGNVREWTSSIYSGGNRGVRGGSWGDGSSLCTVSSSINYGMGYAGDNIGFRVCR